MRNMMGEWDHLCNFGRGHYGEHSCEIILNLDKWFRRRCHLKKTFTDCARQMTYKDWSKWFMLSLWLR